eukprot:363866-Chlamydomonas_euryale.AAC.9
MELQVALCYLVVTPLSRFIERARTHGRRGVEDVWGMGDRGGVQSPPSAHAECRETCAQACTPSLTEADRQPADMLRSYGPEPV